MDKQQLKQDVDNIKKHWDYIIGIEKVAIEWDKKQLIAQRQSIHPDKKQIEEWKSSIRQHQEKIKECRERKKSEIEQTRNK